MGSMITLGIGRMEIDWGKNNTYRNHAALFQSHDIKQVPYYYVDMDTDKPIIIMKEGYSRKLSTVKRRLDLLGYSVYSIRKLYEDNIRVFEELGYKMCFTFDDFYSALSTIDVPQVDSVKIAVDYHENGYDLGEYVRKCILKDPQIEEHLPITYDEQDGDNWRNLKYDLGVFLENLDPYITLRILVENPNNSDLELQWNIADVIEDGWVKREEIVHELTPQEKILLVTEGSSDSFIIRKALVSLYPDISDFFDFVDMEENYPFTGVGNLYNFCLGLARIGIQNNVIVIFDNDTAGVDKYELSIALSKPKTFLITKLPDHTEFLSFGTLGPQGETIENINGKAVSIECFLDFNSIDKIPFIRWTSFNKKKEHYQGELVGKDQYTRAYKNCSLIDGSYDSSKLMFLIDYLLTQWIAAQM